MTLTLDTSTPVLLLGGGENSLAVARHLGRQGIAVRASGEASCWAMHSRYCRERFPIPSGLPAQDYWRDLLLTGANQHLRNHVVFACNDDAIEFLADHRDELGEHYLLDDFVPHLQHAMLDKMRTLELAREVGVPTPNFWKIRSAADVERIRDEVMFPVMVKPINSRRFERVFRRKLFIVDSSFDDLADKVRLSQEHDLEVMVVEMIPGPDDLLSSYYTYIDRSGNHLFHFTKRVLRRYPVNRGPASHHRTEWVPRTAAMGRKFFRGIGFRGMGNIEFKLDRRDGRLKVIEVNSRYTAAHVLLVNAGAPIDLMIYAYLTGQDVPSFDGYEQFRWLWYPVRDIRAFRQLRARGELTLASWLGSVLHRRTDLPIWTPSDPMPSLAVALDAARRIKRLAYGR
jgi:predicted ATP-grasp superfamily ATP-dependent carboligase